MANTISKQTTKVQLGTFSGVFMPSFLTIMGVIIFLRMGYVMGNAGLIQGLLIIILANSISILTSLSVSAVATTIQVKGGGGLLFDLPEFGLGVRGPHWACSVFIPSGFCGVLYYWVCGSTDIDFSDSPTRCRAH